MMIGNGGRTNDIGWMMYSVMCDSDSSIRVSLSDTVLAFEIWVRENVSSKRGHILRSLSQTRIICKALRVVSMLAVFLNIFRPSNCVTYSYSDAN